MISFKAALNEVFRFVSCGEAHYVQKGNSSVNYASRSC